MCHNKPQYFLLMIIIFYNLKLSPKTRFYHNFPPLLTTFEIIFTTTPFRFAKGYFFVLSEVGVVSII